MHFKPLTRNDLRFLTDLQPEEWSDIVPQIDTYLDTVNCYTIKVILNNKIVGIGAGIAHNDVGWLAHIIVRIDQRNKGIGKALTQHLVDMLTLKGCQTLYLVTTDLGYPVYTKIGFSTETEYICYAGIKPDPDWEINKNIIPFSESYKQQIAILDREISGEDRLFYLNKYFSTSYIYLKENKVVGYYIPAVGDGLIIANDAEAGNELMKLRFTMKHNAAFPVENTQAFEFMNKNNFEEVSRFRRMRYGKIKAWAADSVYNVIGRNRG